MTPTVNMRRSSSLLMVGAVAMTWMMWVTFVLLGIHTQPPPSPPSRHQHAPLKPLLLAPTDHGSKSVENIPPFVYVAPKVRAKDALAIRRTDSGWVEETAVCNSNKTFLKTTLKSIAGDVPIYIHDLSIDGISRSLHKTGKWEPELETAFMRCVGNDKDLVFVDIGANIGVYSLTLAKSGRQVIAFEPLLDNAERLCRSVVESGLKDRVMLVFNAVSDRRQTMEVVRDAVSKGGTYVRDGDNGGARGEIIYSIHLDDILEVFPNLTKAVVKIDVERHEARALAHARKFFQQVDVPCMMMEWERHHRSPDGYRLMLEMAEYGMLAYDPKNMAKSLDADKFGQWPANVIWRKVRNYGPNTQ